MSADSLPARMISYVMGVRAEMRKITLPSMEELRQQTIAIIIVVTIIGMIIGVMDWLFSKIFIEFLGRIGGV